MDSPARVETPNPAPAPQPAQPQPEERRTHCQNVCDTIGCIVKGIFLTLLATLLCIFSPTVFIASFAIGIMFSDKVQASIDKITHTLKSHPYLGAFAIAGFCLFGLHATLLVGAAFVGSQLGSLAHQYSPQVQQQVVSSQ